MKEKVLEISKWIILIGSILSSVFGSKIIFFTIPVFGLYVIVKIALIWIAYFLYIKEERNESATTFIIAASSATSFIACIGYIMHYIVKLDIIDVDTYKLNKYSISKVVPILINATILTYGIFIVLEFLRAGVSIWHIAILITFIVLRQYAFVERKKEAIITAIVVSAIFSLPGFIGFGLIALDYYGIYDLHNPSN